MPEESSPHSPDNALREPQSFGFDNQAQDFDIRAGMPAAAAQAVAQELRRLASVSPGNLVLDIGAGTGEFGRFVGNGIRYVGFDVSRPMLEVFAHKLSAARPSSPSSSSSSLLTVADANAHWPVASGSTAVIFFSRAIHLLSQEHVVRESLRIAHPKKAFLTIGQVHRSQDSVRSLMRSEMRRILRGQGITGKGGEKAHTELVSLLDSPLCRFRAASQKTLARWQVEAIPAASLTSWHGKDGLAGVAVSASVKQTVLDQLERWAIEHFGDLQTPQTSEEGYDLTVFETHE